MERQTHYLLVCKSVAPNDAVTIVGTAEWFRIDQIVESAGDDENVAAAHQLKRRPKNSRPPHRVARHVTASELQQRKPIETRAAPAATEPAEPAATEPAEPAEPAATEPAEPAATEPAESSDDQPRSVYDHAALVERLAVLGWPSCAERGWMARYIAVAVAEYRAPAEEILAGLHAAGKTTATLGSVRRRLAEHRASDGAMYARLVA